MKMTANESSIKNRSFWGLVFQHIKSLLAINFSLKNLKWLATLLIFIHLGFLGIHNFLYKRFSDGLVKLLMFCLGFGLFYVPVTGFWIYIVQGAAVLALFMWAFLYLGDFLLIVSGNYGEYDDGNEDDYKFGIFVQTIIIAMLVVYMEYIVLHFHEIPYLPQLLEPALQPFKTVVSFIINIF